jgi:futalosine hydrolase
MTERARILVVAATAKELAPPNGWRTLCCGVGPVESALATAAAIAEDRPALILQVGIAGARRAAGLKPGALVIGRESRYCDVAPAFDWAPSTVSVAPALVDAAHGALPQATIACIGTSARVGGTHGYEVEAMEGFSVLRAAQIAGIPAIEVRAISNAIEEADRAQWRLAEAFAAITGATPDLVAALAATLPAPR